MRVSVHAPGIRWGAFALVCLAYLGVTVGEQALSPVMPDVGAEFGVTEGQSGLAFGLLAFSIAVANLVGGAILGRLGPGPLACRIPCGPRCRARLPPGR